VVKVQVGPPTRPFFTEVFCLKTAKIDLSFSFEKGKEHDTIDNYSNANQNFFRDITFHNSNINKPRLI
jgi:uncharacterized protein YhfF